MSDLPNLTPLHAALQTWRDACKQRRAQERATEQMVTTLLDGYVGEDGLQRVKLIADVEHAISGLEWRIATGADSTPVKGLAAAVDQIDPPIAPARPAGGLAARIAAAEAKTEATKRGVPVVEAMRDAAGGVSIDEIRTELQRQGLVR